MATLATVNQVPSFPFCLLPSAFSALTCPLHEQINPAIGSLAKSEAFVEPERGM
jgi:hypothetical protein